jgi:K+-transporting ATPase ATPase C chain
MSESDNTLSEDREASPLSDSRALLHRQFWPVLLSVPLLTVLTGIVFPLALTVLARPMFRSQADGSLIAKGNRVIGSELIGQSFSGRKYFHSRPSAAGSGYDATASGGTNLGPSNAKLRDGAPGDEPFIGVRQLVEDYRRRNGLPPDALVPIDAVTRSGSGLDPHISPANAALQIPRIAKARPSLSEEQIRRLVAEHTHGRQLGFLGEPRVSVLALNLALDEIAPR